MQNRFGPDTDPFELREREPGDHLLIDEPLTQEPLAETWHGLFLHDQYDWENPEFQKKNRGRYAYRVIPLSRGYFMMVSPQDYKLLTEHADGSKKRWFIHAIHDRETGKLTALYARRSGRGDEPNTVYAHREVLDCLHGSDVVDHKNGYGLDNRRGTPRHPVNLCHVARSENAHNTNNRRWVNFHLPRGVEERGKRFGGIYAKRLSKTKSVVTRSKQTWETPEEAALWYQKQLEKMHNGRKEWAHNPSSVNFPIFPPLKQVDDIGEIPF